jgi:ADP-ribose pyrophosphatase
MDSECFQEKLAQKKPKVVDVKLLVDDFIQLRRDMISLDGLDPYPYFVVTGASESSAILALSEEGELLLTREYRHPVGCRVWSCPGGALGPRETPLDAAQRELLEETGCTAESFEAIGKTFPLPGIFTHTTNVVLARGAKKTSAPSREANEWLDAEFLPFSEVEKIVRAAVDIDGILCQALYFYELYRRRQ